MAQYKKRVELFKAISVPSVLSGIESCPQWVQNRYAEGKIVLQLGTSVVVATPKGKVVATVTDSIVQDALKNLSVLPTSAFEALYEEE